MRRALSLAAVVTAAFALPAMAADNAAAPANTDGKATITETGALTVSANAEQVRKLLLSQGYTNVSELNRNENGHWTGTAMKDGKTIFVAVNLPPKPMDAPAKN